MTKILKKFCEWENILNYYEYFRLQHSRILNDVYLEGELCLSIHPLDYLTMSDNECGWTSCMSHLDRGSYRTGTVEMMNSPCVVVAYLHNPKKKMMINGIEWNSKQWRTLFIVDKDIIINIKNYPYRHDELTAICLDWLKELAEDAGYSYYPNVMYYDTVEGAIDDEAPEEVKNERNNFFDFRFSTGHMYNDFSENHACYVNAYLPYEAVRTINYSGPLTCLRCGEVIYEGSDDCVFCDDCEPRYYCGDCGDIVRIDDEDQCDYYIIDGDYYCRYCAESMESNGSVCWCEDDQEYHYQENCYEVVRESEDEHWYISKYADLDNIKLDVTEYYVVNDDDMVITIKQKGEEEEE